MANRQQHTPNLFCYTCGNKLEENNHSGYCSTDCYKCYEEFGDNDDAYYGDDYDDSDGYWEEDLPYDYFE